MHVATCGNYVTNLAKDSYGYYSDFLNIYFGSFMSVDAFIVAGYLALTLYIGLGHGSKIKTIKDYALGGRNFSTTALVSTITATYASGSGFFTNLSQIYFEGFYYVVIFSFMSVELLLIALIFVPKMGRFLGTTSVAEAMGNFYGKEARIITAFAGAISSAGFVAVQFNAFGSVIGYFSGISNSTAIVLAGMVVTFYSAFGGIRAVTFTDVLQVFTFFFALPLTGIMIWNQLYSSGFSLSEALQVQKFSFSHVLDFENPKFWDMIPIILVYIMPAMRSEEFQRISMGSNINQIRKAWVISAILLIVIKSIMVWIPFLLFSVNPNLSQHELLGYVIDNYTYSGLKGIFIIGIISLAMSTADSTINTSSVLFANDICKPLKIGNNKELLYAKLYSLIIGVVAIALALTGKNLLEMILIGYIFYMPVVTAPFLLTILGFRTTKISVLIGMAGGFGSVILWKLAGIKHDPNVFGILMNLVFLMGSHYLLKQPGGWVGIDDPEYHESVRKKRLARREMFVKIRSILSNLSSSRSSQNTLNLLKIYAPDNPLTYMGFGIYCVVCTITTMYTTQIELKGENSQMILGIYQFMMVTGTLMASYPVWPLSIKQKYKETIAHVMWFPSVFFMLAFFSAFFVMVSHFAPLQFVLFSINTILVITLVGWKMAMLMIITGFYFAIAMYNSYSLEPFHTELGSPEAVLMYSVLLITTVVVIFLKPKEERIARTRKQLGLLSKKVEHYDKRLIDKQKEADRLGIISQKILNNVNHELRLPVGNVVNFSEMLDEMLKSSDQKYLQGLSDEIRKNSHLLSTMILNMLDLATLNVNNIELKKQKMNVSELVRERVRTCRNLYLKDKNIDFDVSIEDEIMLLVDPDYIRQTIDNLVINAISFSNKGVIRICFSKQSGEVVFMIEDQGIGIPKSEIYDIFTPFKMASNTESKANGRGVGLALCKAAITSHGGDITVKSSGKGTIFKVYLPLI